VICVAIARAAPRHLLPNFVAAMAAVAIIRAQRFATLAAKAFS
jgi:hypothetical protein